MLLQIIQKYIAEDKKIVVVEGDSRNEILMNGIAWIEQRGELDEETVIVTHDAVRSFVTEYMIEENVEAAKKYGAFDTVIPSTDTIVSSHDGEMIAEIPNRKDMYQGQTPQSFKAQMLKNLYEALTEYKMDNSLLAVKDSNHKYM